MGAHGRARVQRYFTWEQVAKQTVEVYGEVRSKE
jgi:glycosyltransferase involved in cell wall biosynthesis